MAQVFTPVEEVFVPAPSHGAGYQYRVAFGVEKWPAQVFGLKVQVVRGSRVLGRQAPTFPTSTEFQAVTDALTKLEAKYRSQMGWSSARAAIESALEQYPGCDQCADDWTGGGEAHLNGRIELPAVIHEAVRHVRSDNRPDIKDDEEYIGSLKLKCRRCREVMTYHTELEVEFSDSDDID